MFLFSSVHPDHQAGSVYVPGITTVDGIKVIILSHVIAASLELDLISGLFSLRKCTYDKRNDYKKTDRGLY